MRVLNAKANWWLPKVCAPPSTREGAGPGRRCSSNSRAKDAAGPIGLELKEVTPPRMVTCELSRVCWLRRNQHNRQHMQITRRREKACQEPKRP